MLEMSCREAGSFLQVEEGKRRSHMCARCSQSRRHLRIGIKSHDAIPKNLQAGIAKARSAPNEQVEMLPKWTDRWVHARVAAPPPAR